MLVAAQVGLSLLLVIAAGLFTRTLHNLQTVDAGFRHEGVLMVDVNVRRALHAENGDGGDSRIAAIFRDGLEAAAGVPGVSAVAVSDFTPISGGYWSQAVQVEGQPATEEETIFLAVSPGFFGTLGMPIRMGRDFTARDDGSAPAAVIVNEEFVRRFVPAGRNPLGQYVSASDSRFWKHLQIVGVVGNSRPYSLREPVRPCAYVSFFQQPAGRIAFGTFEVRAAGSLSAVAAMLPRALGRQLPGVPLEVRAFTAQVEDSIRREILMAQLAGFFGILALILAAIGLYGLLAYAVAQRTPEIGIRIALGAKPGEVVRMMLGRGLLPVAAGIAAALPAAWWGCRFVAALLYGMKPFDPGSVGGAIAVLALVAAAAGFVPARRAAKVNPVAALRQE
jgi:predicted permease